MISNSLKIIGYRFCRYRPKNCVKTSYIFIEIKILRPNCCRHHFSELNLVCGLQEREIDQFIELEHIHPFIECSCDNLEKVEKSEREEYNTQCYEHRLILSLEDIVDSIIKPFVYEILDNYSIILIFVFLNILRLYEKQAFFIFYPQRNDLVD